jgi:hypothetical protein
MDSENQQCYQTAPPEVQVSAEHGQAHHPKTGVQRHKQDGTMVSRSGAEPKNPHCSIEGSEALEILKQLKGGRLLMVNSRRRNGLILYKQYHAEFAGPGAAVGGVFDEDCQYVLPVGDLSLIYPDSHDDRQKAYLIRRQWIRLTQQFTDKSVPVQRAQMILNQFENYFDQDTIARIPDEAFALLVGVLPPTVRLARRPPGGQLKVKRSDI